MKSNVNSKKYPNIDEAVAFRVSFAPMLYTYDSTMWTDYQRVVCSTCSCYEQFADFPTPAGPSSKLDRAILDSYDYGLSVEVRNLLIDNFTDITENDFRPCRNKSGDIVFYQITPIHVMKPMAEKLKDRALKPCRKCGRVQYRHKELKNELGNEYYYITKEALEDLHSINRSFEEYNMYFPNIVVSREVYDFLMTKYPRMEFRPMFLKE